MESKTMGTCSISMGREAGLKPAQEAAPEVCQTTTCCEGHLDATWRQANSSASTDSPWWNMSVWNVNQLTKQLQIRTCEKITEVRRVGMAALWFSPAQVQGASILLLYLESLDILADA